MLSVCLYRYKREEVKIQAWENHEKRKAEMEMKRMEVILNIFTNLKSTHFEDRSLCSETICALDPNFRNDESDDYLVKVIENSNMRKSSATVNELKYALLVKSFASDNCR